MRPPVVAGQFYAGTRSGLLKQIEKCYLHPLGPGHLPTLKRGERCIKGAVVPHAGYEYSGPIAAHVYSALAEDGFPETFIIIGPDHQHFGEKVAITTQTFSTPLGEIRVDEALARKMFTDPIEDDPVAHSAEHSIEVQLPFLQHLSSKIQFVPVCMTSQDIETAREVGKIIGKVVKEKDVVILASTDFTHAGPAYFQLPPPAVRVDRFAKKQDELAIDAILNLDPERLCNVVEEHNISMCGVSGVAAMLFGLKETASSGKLLKYATSYEIFPANNAVGYGAIVIS